MDPLNSLSQITQILRQKFSERSGRALRKNVGISSQNASPASTKRVQGSDEEVKRRVRERIKGLSAEERRGKRGAQIFVESVLMWDFGEQLLRDPRFTEMSKEVVTAMEENSTVWKQLQKLLDELVSSGE